jgi:hypothetical protein
MLADVSSSAVAGIWLSVDRMLRGLQLPVSRTRYDDVAGCSSPPSPHTVRVTQVQCSCNRSIRVGAKSDLGWGQASQVDVPTATASEAKSSLGGAKSSLGDAESSLGD